METIFLGIIALGVLGLFALKLSEQWEWLRDRDDEPMTNVRVIRDYDPDFSDPYAGDPELDTPAFVPCDICGGQHHDDDHFEPWHDDNGVLVVRDDSGEVVPCDAEGLPLMTDDEEPIEAKLRRLRGDDD